MNENSTSNPIGQWLESFNEDWAIERLKEIDAELARLGDEQSYINDALALRKRWAHAGGHETSDEASRLHPVPEVHVSMDGPAPEGKTAAVLRILGSDPDRTFSAQEIKQTMISRGWMTSDERDYASLMSTLSRLTGESAPADVRIYRPTRGKYRLSPPPGDDAP